VKQLFQGANTAAAASAQDVIVSDSTVDRLQRQAMLQLPPSLRAVVQTRLNRLLAFVKVAQQADTSQSQPFRSYPENP
jgi:Asp-tRNA(Asn)/Glu-tRNA(Gln) amidotransferase C subunit